MLLLGVMLCVICYDVLLILFQIDTGDRYVTHTNGLLIKNVEESDEDIYTCRAVVYETGELAERIIKLEVNMIKIYFLYVVQDSVVNI